MAYVIISLESIQQKGKSYLSFSDHPYGVAMSLCGNFDEMAVKEMTIYIDQLVRKNGPAPFGIELFILKVKSPFRTYITPALFYTVESKACDRYINKLDKGVKFWDEDSLKQLREMNHPYYEKYINKKK